jgi:hypothetical protein
MNADNNLVQKCDERPARMDGACFYCHQPIGLNHSHDCVIPARSVVMRFSVELVMSVPAKELQGSMERRFNNGTWCADNFITMLEGLRDRTECLCGYVRAEYLREATALDHEGQAFSFDQID